MFGTVSLGSLNIRLRSSSAVATLLKIVSLGLHALIFLVLHFAMLWKACLTGSKKLHLFITKLLPCQREENTGNMK